MTKLIIGAALFLLLIGLAACAITKFGARYDSAFDVDFGDE